MQNTNTHTPSTNFANKGSATSAALRHAVQLGLDRDTVKANKDKFFKVFVIAEGEAAGKFSYKFIQDKAQEAAPAPAPAPAKAAQMLALANAQLSEGKEVVVSTQPEPVAEGMQMPTITSQRGGVRAVVQNNAKRPMSGQGTAGKVWAWVAAFVKHNRALPTTDQAKWFAGQAGINSNQLSIEYGQARKFCGLTGRTAGLAITEAITAYPAEVLSEFEQLVEYYESRNEGTTVAYISGN